MQISLEQHVAAPPMAVWRVLTDLDAAAQHLTGVTGIERLPGPDGYTVGTRWRETRKMIGTEASEEMEVVAVEDGLSTEISSEAQGVRYRTRFELHEVPHGTLLTMTFSGERESATAWSRLVERVTSRLGERISRRAMAQDLADIGAAAEELGA